MFAAGIARRVVRDPIDPESRLSRAAWLVTKPVRRGRVIQFAGDPMFREFWYSAFMPYVNALLIGPNMQSYGRY